MICDHLTWGSVPSVYICVAGEATLWSCWWGLRVVDRHGLHGVGQVSFLLLLLPSCLFLCFLSHLLINRSGLDELDDLSQTCRVSKEKNNSLSYEFKKHLKNFGNVLVLTTAYTCLKSIQQVWTTLQQCFTTSQISPEVTRVTTDWNSTFLCDFVSLVD